MTTATAFTASHTIALDSFLEAITRESFAVDAGLDAITSEAIALGIQAIEAVALDAFNLDVSALDTLTIGASNADVAELETEFAALRSQLAALSTHAAAVVAETAAPEPFTPIVLTGLEVIDIQAIEAELFELDQEAARFEANNDVFALAVAA